MPCQHPTAIPLQRRWSFFCCVALTCLVLNALNAQNLVTNPGFENGTTTWFGGSLTTSSLNTHSGSACGSATAGAFGTACGQIMLGKMPAGQTYAFSAWVRVASGSPPITIRLDQTDSAGFHSTTLATKTVTTAWVQCSTNFSLSVTGTLTDLTISFVAWNMPLTLFLDDVSITNSSPALGIVPTNQSVFLSWPTTATNYTLQTATNLAAPINWVAVTNTVQSDASTFSLTIPAANSSSFFRLQHP